MRRKRNKREAPVALSWSGGKDSALALWALREELAIEPVALLTTLTEDYDRISMHGVRGELLRAQARATGVELVEIGIPAACPNETYEERMTAALARPPLAQASTIAFADLYLADVRAYREERLAAGARSALFPLWGRDTAALAREFIAAGFEATLVCVDPTQLDPSFVGRPFDEALLTDLPPDVDPCGENGEFHTFVHAGPIFDERIEVEPGETVMREGFAFADLIPAAQRPPEGSSVPPSSSTERRRLGTVSE
ncbi:MAG TPA: ATP-binding protein [Solirubrobacterales bacterium]